jgi:molybdopterin-guanine dinucleotide biosynthesis protein A
VSFESAEGFVLAGGLSSRMGRDMALLRLDGAPLVGIAVGKLRAAGLGARIVGVRPDLAGYAPVVEDLRPGCGPLGGIEAALAASESELNVFIPVDLPLLPADFLQWMVDRASVSGAGVTVPRVLGRAQPLCCVIRREMVALIGRALDAGQHKVMPALASGSVDLFDVEALAPIQRGWPVEPIHRWFQNLNFPEDLAGLT